MNRSKIFGIVLFFVVSAILFSNLVAAIGISPGRTTINFEPGLQEEVEFIIFNSEAKDMSAVVYIEGELAEYVTLQDAFIEFGSNEESKTSSYRIKLPGDLEPGTHEAKIVVREVPKDYAHDGAFIGATAAVVTQLHVVVPYPGKYATVEIKVSETGQGQPITFLVPVSNFGTQDIVKAKGIIDIYGANNEKVVTIETSESGIVSKERVELVGVWNTEEANPGKYYAKVSVTYDGEVATAETVFDYGNLQIDILEVNVKDFRLGEIAKFNILVQNLWSDTISDVFAEMVVLDEQGDEVIRFKSASENIPGGTKEELVAFWDTEGIKVGTYGGRLVVHYEDKTTEKQIKTIVGRNSIRVEFVGATAQVVALSGEGGVNKDIMVLLLFVLVGINIAWFVYFKKKNAVPKNSEGNV